MSRPFCSHVAMLQDGASSGVFLGNKLAVALRIVQFWSEIKLVITNRAFDFRPNCTPFNAITIMYLIALFILANGTFK